MTSRVAHKTESGWPAISRWPAISSVHGAAKERWLVGNGWARQGNLSQGRGRRLLLVQVSGLGGALLKTKDALATGLVEHIHLQPPVDRQEGRPLRGGPVTSEAVRHELAAWRSPSADLHTPTPTL